MQVSKLKSTIVLPVGAVQNSTFIHKYDCPVSPCLSTHH